MYYLSTPYPAQLYDLFPCWQFKSVMTFYLLIDDDEGNKYKKYYYDNLSADS